MSTVYAGLTSYVCIRGVRSVAMLLTRTPGHAMTQHASAAHYKETMSLH